MGLRLRPLSIIPLDRPAGSNECISLSMWAQCVFLCCVEFQFIYQFMIALFWLIHVNFFCFTFVWMMSLICRFLLYEVSWSSYVNKKIVERKAMITRLVFGWIPVFHSHFLQCSLSDWIAFSPKEYLLLSRIFHDGYKLSRFGATFTKEIQILNWLTEIHRIPQKRQSTSDIVTRPTIFISANERFWLTICWLKWENGWALPFLTSERDQ